MPSSATVCFVLAAVYCIANILVVRKSTRWSNQMWAGGSSNGRTRIMFKSFWDASVCRSSGCGCCCVVSGILPLQESKKMCKVFAYQNPSMHFDSLYTSLHFVQQCLAPQQYVSCWLRSNCIANILVARICTHWSNQMWAGGSSNGRTRIMFKSFRMLLSVGLLVRLLLCCFRHFTASRV